MSRSKVKPRTSTKTRQMALVGLLALALLATACGSRVDGPESMQVVGGQAGQQGQATTEGAGTDSAASTGGTVEGAGADSAAAATDSGPAVGTDTDAAQDPAAAGPATKGDAAAPKSGGISVSGPDSQGISDSTIKLGVIAPLSGAAGFLGEAEVAAIRAYTSMVNARGGVKGRKYSTVIVDSQFIPELEAQAARKLVDKDKVFALFSVLGDSTGPFVTKKGIPTLVFALNPPAFSSKYPTTYITGFSTMDSVTRMAYSLKVIQKKPINSTAILYDTQNVPIAPWVKYLSAAWKAVGVEVKSEDAFNIADGDCTNIVLKMQQLKIDFWQSAQSLGWPACAAAMGRQNYQPPFFKGGPYTSDNKFITQGGIGMDKAYGEQVGIQIVQSFGQPYPYEGGSASTKAPLADEYVNSIKKYAPNSADTDTLESIWTQTFWVAVQFLTKAIEAQSDALTWKGVNQWMQGQKNYKSGLIAPINFDPKCKTGSPVWLYQWVFNKEKNVFEQTSWKGYGGPFTMPDAHLNKIFPGAGQCYLTAAADAEL